MFSSPKIKLSPLFVMSGERYRPGLLAVLDNLFGGDVEFKLNSFCE